MVRLTGPKYTLHGGALLLLAALLAGGGLLAAYSILARGATYSILAVGDIGSCASDHDEATAALLDGRDGTIVTLGDTVYESGTAAEFARCYDPAWGRYKARTRPAVGNHEYLTPGAAGYYDYFGAAAGAPGAGYYSYDLGAWHIVVLNSNCSQVGGCQAGSAQEQWLRADLATHPTACSLAYWHHPRFSSGEHGSFAAVQPLWQALYDHGADLTLAGHDHHYERFAPQDAAGQPDPDFGLRQFVVGTGGKNLRPVGTPIANSEVRQSDTFGVLQLSLEPDGYRWQFLAETGSSFTDQGQAACHGRPASSIPLAPPLPSAVARRGVSAPVGSLSAAFRDGFDAPNLDHWSSSTGLALESAGDERWVLASTGGAPAFAIRELSPPQPELYYRLRFRIVSQGPNTVYLLRFRNERNASLLGLFVARTGKLGYRNDLTDESVTSDQRVADGQWHELQAYVRSSTPAELVEIWLDGARVDALSRPERFGTGAVARIQLGDSAADKTFEVAFDDVAVGDTYIAAD